MLIKLEIGKDVQTVQLEIYDDFKRKLTIRGGTEAYVCAFNNYKDIK